MYAMLLTPEQVRLLCQVGSVLLGDNFLGEEAIALRHTPHAGGWLTKIQLLDVSNSTFAPAVVLEGNGRDTEGAFIGIIEDARRRVDFEDSSIFVEEGDIIEVIEAEPSGGELMMPPTARKSIPHISARDHESGSDGRRFHKTMTNRKERRSVARKLAEVLG